MHIRFVRPLLLIALSVAIACAERRPLAPVSPPEPLVHEPWEDEEAEILAFLVSGKLTAPRDLYEQIRSDLAKIRYAWGSQFPELNSITVRNHFATQRISLGMTVESYEAIREGTYRDWDSLNTLLEIGFISLSPYYPTAYLRFLPRVNACRVIDAYERLSGVRWASTNGFWLDGPRLYARDTEHGISYVFRDADGDCPSGCIRSTFYYFITEADSIQFVGRWSTREGGPAPPWIDEIWIARSHFESGDETYLTRDRFPPGRVADLCIDSLLPNGRVVLSFTIPGNDGTTGQSSYAEAAAALGPINEINWDSFPYMREVARVGQTGSRMQMSVFGLRSDTVSSLAIRVYDGRSNASGISNILQVIGLK